MHIPDGFLSAPVAVACATLSVVAVGAAARRSSTLFGSRAVAKMGVTAAFVFAAQLINFPVLAGTSGHLIGGVLAAVLLGPSAAVVIMTAVLAMQCLLFGDGGLLALGANVLNMGLVHPVLGFAVYRVTLGILARRKSPTNAARIASMAFASWFATVAAAATCAGELALSGVAAPGLVLTTMVGVHLAIGLGEAMITALIVAALLRLDPAMVVGHARDPRNGFHARSSREGRPGAVGGADGFSSAAVMGLAVALGVAFFLSPFVCPWPDGFERTVARLGIVPVHDRLAALAPLHDYALPGFAPGSPWMAPLVGVAGTLVVFGLCCAIGFWLSRAPISQRP